jgi:hypothetical protein
MRRAGAIVWILAMAVSVSATAQDMGAAAAKEKKRREAQKAASEKAKAKTFTDEDLPKQEGVAGTAPEESETSRGSSASDEDKRARAAEIKASLGKCQATLVSARAALKAAETEMPPAPVPSDDPFTEEPPDEGAPSPEEALRQARQSKDEKVQAAKLRIGDVEKQCAEIEDSARQENIPAGWIR